MGHVLQHVAPIGRVAVDVVHDLRLKNEEATVDPCAVPVGFLAKRLDLVAAFVHVDGPKPARGLGNRHRGHLAVLVVECDLACDVDVTHGVAVCEAKGLIADEIASTSNPATVVRGRPGIDQRHSPRFARTVVNLHRVRRKVEGHVGVAQDVAREVFLDHVPLVAKEDEEVVQAM